MPETVVMPDRLLKIFGKEFYHGILGDDLQDANAEFNHLARRKLVQHKADYYCGIYLTEKGLDELSEEGRLPVFMAMATRAATQFKKSEIKTLLHRAIRHAVGQLHEHGIEAEWSGSVNSPLYVSDQLDLEESTYEKGTRVFQGWYQDSLIDSGKSMGEDPKVTSLLLDFVQKMALSGMDPWMLDMKWISERFGIGKDQPLQERDVRMMLADIAPKPE